MSDYVAILAKLDEIKERCKMTPAGSDVLPLIAALRRALGDITPGLIQEHCLRDIVEILEGK
jgi:hypothetical protein